jgi:hypothetical protein
LLHGDLCRLLLLVTGRSEERDDLAPAVTLRFGTVVL